MILVDTSVWVDHLRSGDETLGAMLDAGRVLTHPFVIGEVALGSLRRRGLILSAMSDLPFGEVATDTEVLALIDRCALSGRGVGYVDAHLLACAFLTAGTKLWTRDGRLRDVASNLGVAMAGGAES